MDALWMLPTMDLTVTHLWSLLRAKLQVFAGLVIVWALALVFPAGAAAQAGPASQVQRTGHYTLELAIGDAEMMISPMDAMGAQTGEVMVNGGALMSASHDMGGGAARGMPPMAAALVWPWQLRAWTRPCRSITTSKCASPATTRGPLSAT